MLGGTAGEGSASWIVVSENALCLFGIVRRLTLPVFPENYGSVDCSDDPKHSVDELDPDSVLHADDAAVAFRVFFDVHLAKDAKGSQVEDEDEPVNSEEEPSLD